jgi:hypothetical protein
MKPFCLPTNKMASYLGVSKDFLLKKIGDLFIEGIHFNRPFGYGNNRILWVVEKMEEWALNRYIPQQYLKIIEKI